LIYNTKQIFNIKGFSCFSPISEILRYIYISEGQEAQTPLRYNLCSYSYQNTSISNMQQSA